MIRIVQIIQIIQTNNNKHIIQTYKPNELKQTNQIRRTASGNWLDYTTGYVYIYISLSLYISIYIYIYINTYIWKVKGGAGVWISPGLVSVGFVTNKTHKQQIT